MSKSAFMIGFAIVSVILLLVCITTAVIWMNFSPKPLPRKFSKGILYTLIILVAINLTVFLGNFLSR
ncbi:hypothetical protein BH10BAC2_BH10BAC2_16010 [soil metagenome]